MPPLSKNHLSLPINGGCSKRGGVIFEEMFLAHTTDTSNVTDSLLSLVHALNYYYMHGVYLCFLVPFLQRK